MTFLSRLRISVRLILIAATAAAGVLFVSIDRARSIRPTQMSAHERETRQEVETAWSVAQTYYALAQKGAISVADAKREALATIGGLRYGKDMAGYFWVQDASPRMLMHPIKPELDGKDLSQEKDPTGKLLFVAFAQTAKAHGAGFVSYRWPRPGAAKPVPKLSYVKGFAPWGWIVGSGIYVDDVDAAVSSQTRSVAIVSAAILGGLILVVFLIARSITRPLGRLVAATRRLGTGDLGGEIETDGPEEVHAAGEALSAPAVAPRGRRRRRRADRGRRPDGRAARGVRRRRPRPCARDDGREPARPRRRDGGDGVGRRRDLAHHGRDERRVRPRHRRHRARDRRHGRRRRAPGPDGRAGAHRRRGGRAPSARRRSASPRRASAPPSRSPRSPSRRTCSR